MRKLNLRDLKAEIIILENPPNGEDRQFILVEADMSGDAPIDMFDIRKGNLLYVYGGTRNRYQEGIYEAMAKAVYLNDLHQHAIPAKKIKNG